LPCGIWCKGLGNTSTWRKEITMKDGEAEKPALVEAGKRRDPVKGDVYRHNKTIGLYFIEGLAYDANNGSPSDTLVIYRSATTGYMYARNKNEFLDNNGEKYRFERLVTASSESERD
jgi:hypothetical protein